MTHKAGFVNIIGNPNVGKSTFMNAILGERLSIITSKSQTTRHRILGILNRENYQIVFSDTPGIIEPAYKLQVSMMHFVKSAFEDADVLIYLVEVGETSLKSNFFFDKIINSKIPVILLLNKIDKHNQKNVDEKTEYWKEKVPNSFIYAISALEKFNIEGVLYKIIELLPENPPYYPKDQLTDKSERFFVNEKIREKILIHYEKEVPYSVEVETESFKEEEEIVHIQSVIIVERNSQKGIIIGHKGAALKRIGTESRKELEIFFQKKVFLELYVKVNKNWKSDKNQLKRFGYNQG